MWRNEPFASDYFLSNVNSHSGSLKKVSGGEGAQRVVLSTKNVFKMQY